MSIIKGKTNIVAGFGGTKRPLGEVYFSQSSLATDNTGALPGWTGEYYENGKALFPDLYNFVKAHSELQVTKAQYDNAIATYGECPKYVVDENTAQTSLRLPKYARSHGVVIKEKKPTDTDPTWYRLYSDGWLEQGGITGKVADYETATITLPLQFLDTHYIVTYGNWRTGTTDDTSFNSAAVLNISTKTTTKFEIYSRGNADGGRIFTWYACGQGANGSQENTLYPWVSAYNSAIPASVAQAAEFTGALASKANIDLANTTPATSFINKSMAWGIPDYSAGVSVSYPYTAPTAGLYTAYCTTGNDYLEINGVNIGTPFSANNHAAVFVKAGDVVQVKGTGPATCKFFPLKGVNNA